MKISKAEHKDLDKILKLQYIAYEKEALLYNDFNIPPLMQTIEQLIKESKSSIILKATEGDIITGSVRGSLQNGTCKIGRLIVHPDFQRKGTGLKLLLEIEKHFLKTESFELFTGADSKDNLRLYKKAGYTEFKREKLTDKITLVFLKKKCVF